MMPDDIAEAFDQLNLFSEKRLVLRSWPDYWEVNGIRLVDNPQRVIIPAAFWIKRRETSEDDPATIERYAKFDPSGEVRCMIGMADYRPIPDAEHGVLCAVPHQVQISYPLEKTVLTIRLSNVELNPKLNPTVFEVPKPSPSGSGSVTRIPPGR
jgi:hypothetical protein